MTSSLPVTMAVEGNLDEVVLRKVLRFAGMEAGAAYGKRGKSHLRKNILRYNEAAHHGRWVVLVDLNADAQCPPPFVQSWLPQPNPNLQLRVAVRAVEAWLLADRRKLAKFLGVSEARLPVKPEEEDNPKRTLINIARRSRKRSIREGIVPRPDGSASEGPGYTPLLIQFTIEHWSPQRAANCAPSLKRTMGSLLRWCASRNA